MRVELKGVQEVIKKLGMAGTMSVLRAPMQRSMYRLQADMATYPPAPAHSRYRRTGTLGRRWLTNVVVYSDRITGTIGNNTSYGPLVQSSKFQRKIFKRIGWPTDADVLDRETDRIVDDFQSTIDIELNGFR